MPLYFNHYCFYGPVMSLPMYYVVQTMECSLSQGSDKVVIVICKLASNNIRKQRALTQLINSATSNSLTTVSLQNSTYPKVTAAYQPSI